MAASERRAGKPSANRKNASDHGHGGVPNGDAAAYGDNKHMSIVYSMLMKYNGSQLVE